MAAKKKSAKGKAAPAKAAAKKKAPKAKASAKPKAARAKPKVARAKPKAARAKPKAAVPSVLGPSVNLVELAARLPAITAVERAAFVAQHDAASCVVLGSRTKSAAVRECAVQWVLSAAGLLGGPEKGLIAYAPERLAFMVELLLNLDEERAKGAAGGATSVVLRNTRDLARVRVHRARKQLLRVLTRATRGDAHKTGSLDSLRGRGDADRDVAEAVIGLAGIVRELCQGSATQRAVAASYGLSVRTASEAESAARTLLDAREDVGLGAKGALLRDTTEVNTLEGRILYEMRDLKAAIDDARDDGATMDAMQITAGVAAAFHTRAEQDADAQPGGPAA